MASQLPVDLPPTQAWLTSYRVWEQPRLFLKTFSRPTPTILLHRPPFPTNNRIFTLPNEILEHIASYLEEADAASHMTVNTGFRTLAQPRRFRKLRIDLSAQHAGELLRTLTGNPTIPPTTLDAIRPECLRMLEIIATGPYTSSHYANILLPTLLRQLTTLEAFAFDGTSLNVNLARDFWWSLFNHANIRHLTLTRMPINTFDINWFMNPRNLPTPWMGN